RDLAAGRLAGAAEIIAPRTVRHGRAVLAALAHGVTELAAVLTGADWPIIVRPVGSHAGRGLERIDGPGALGAYLDGHAEASFYIAPFVDYRSPDGLYRKYRVAFVEGRPFLVHLAISGHWMVHYLNAGMLDDATRRAEEAQAMAGFDQGFAQRHRRAFAALTQRFDLDYFGIDCAETADGRLLVFEVDNALIVHDMDPPELFPYKSPAVRRLFAAFQDMLERRAG
ncbi:MAG TPA: hypothetical protein VG939_08740, partial [Caulobacteraceae bacterium]|nr:hypothetical protein [Caulobacteraceae bacterium]